MLKNSGYGRNLAFLSAAGMALLVAMGSGDRAVAQFAEDGRQCSEATLHGSYGFTAAGRRAIGPTTEQFIAVGLRTYDGHGGFSDVGSFHGDVLPATRGIGGPPQVFGTYLVNADCTGTSILYPPAPIPPIESDFVIVNSGKSVRGAVMSPQPNVVTETLERL